MKKNRAEECKQQELDEFLCKYIILIQSMFLSFFSIFWNEQTLTIIIIFVSTRVFIDMSLFGLLLLLCQQEILQTISCQQILILIIFSKCII